MITLFTLPKAFTDAHINVIQRNAIQSWLNLEPTPEVILLGDDDGVHEVAREFNLKHIPLIGRNEYGTPLVDSVFNVGALAAIHDVVCYINCDIIVPPAFQECVEIVADNYRKFLMIGRRWDLDVVGPVDFTGEGMARLYLDLAQNGVQHGIYGIDYFAHRKNLWLDIPKFAIGRWSWDNWLVAQALENDAVVVDATQPLMVIHQNHGYNHQADREHNPEAASNRAMAGNKIAGVMQATVKLRRGE